MQMTISINRLLDTVRLGLLSLMLFYILYVQYAFGEIEGVLPITGAILLMLEVLSLRYNIKHYKNITYLLLYLLVFFVIGGVFAIDRSAHFSLLMDMARLCIPLICLCGYVGSSKQRLNQILLIISVAVFLLSISLFTKGEQFGYYGSITVNNLNTNMFSSFLLLGIISKLLMLSNSSYKTMVKWLIIAAIIIELIAQLRIASRRGVLVFIFMIVTYIHTIMTIKYKRKMANKVGVVLLLLLGVFVLLTYFEEHASNFVVFERFMGKYTVGDANRREFQDVAWRLFTDNPIVGQGFGAVSSVVGMYSHSMYYEVLASTGILGAGILFLPMIIFAYQMGRQSCVGSQMEINVKLRTMLWAIIGIFLSGIAVVFIYDVTFYLLIALIAMVRNVYMTKCTKAPVVGAE